MKKNILQVCGYAAPYPGNFIASLVALADENEKYGYKTIFAFPESAREREWCQKLEKIMWFTICHLRELELDGVHIEF